MTTTISPIKFEDVLSTYSGKAHACCCGCSGKYSYTKLGQQNYERGYPIDDDEINERSAKIIVNKINRALAEGNENDVYQDGDQMIVYETETRTYFVILNK